VSQARHRSELDALRAEIRAWLEEHLSGEYADLRGVGGPGREHERFAERLAWNQHLADHGWTCVGWPPEYGGRGLSLEEQVVFHEEYARADAPARVNHLGEELLGPTLIAHGTDEQRRRFLPGIRDVTEMWCQGYSEPGAGSDLASVATRARLDPSTGSGSGEWIIDGQKIWTSLAHEADWIFVLCRTEPGSVRHRGLSFLLVPMEQPGVEVRPIEQLTGGSEFNEVFFSEARTDATMVVGEPGDGWRIATTLLGFERGGSTLGQQVGFARELEDLTALARRNGSIEDPVIADRLASAYVDLQVMRANVVRGLAEEQPPSIGKLVWAGWHRRLGELAMEVCATDGLTVEAEPYELDRWQRLYLFSRADTIYGGSDEIQKNILAERVLGLPKESRP